MGECLREVTEVLVCRGVHLLGVEPEGPAERQELIEEGIGFIARAA